MTISQKKVSKTRQLRLLVPPEWISELDTVAKVRNFKTRLSLIRHYLREMLDLDLLRLEEHFSRQDKIKKAKFKTDNWLQERLERLKERMNGKV